MKDRKFRVAVLGTHPIQYSAPLFKRLALNTNIDLAVFYFSDHGINPARLDPGFGSKYAWDIQLLDGYRNVFLQNLSPSKSVSNFFGCVNPGIFLALWQGHYDAILVNGWSVFSHWLAFFSAWLSRTPIFVYGDSVSIQRRPWYIHLLKRLVLTPLFSTFSGFLISGTFNQDFYSSYRVPSRRMFKFPWAIDNDRFFVSSDAARANRNSVRASWGIPKELPTAIFSGKLIRRKRPADLLRAVEQLQGHWGLVFVGEGSERKMLESYVREHDVKYVRFLGFVNQADMPNVYSFCDVLCMPSEHDPRCTVVNEAMACALPVVISKGVGVWGEGDIVRHGVNGFVHEIGDVQSLVHFLSVLGNDRDLRETMSRASRQIIQKWSYREDEEGLIAALESLKPSEVE